MPLILGGNRAGVKGYGATVERFAACSVAKPANPKKEATEYLMGGCPGAWGPDS